MLKNKMKLFLLFSIIFIALVGVGFATDAYDSIDSGSDAAQTVESDNMDNNEITNSNGNTISDFSIKKDTADKDFSQLSQSIGESDDLTLEDNYIKTEEGNPITINKTISIEGNNHVIDANSNSGLFVIGSDADVTIKNLTIKNTFGEYSAIVNYGKLTLINVNFENVHTNYSASVVSTQSSSSFTMINSSVDNSTCVSGIIELRGSGTNVIQDSNFTNCRANNAVVRLWSQKSVTVDNCRFLNNYATLYGGAINSQGYLVVNSSYFENNTAEVRGGAIALRSGNATIMNNEFVSNKVERENPSFQQQGGAISIDTNNVCLINNTMTGNTAFNGSDIFIRSGNASVLTTEVTDLVAVEDEEFTISVNVHDDNGNSVSGCYVKVIIDTYEYKIYVQDGIGTYLVTDPVASGNYSVNATIYNTTTEKQNVISGNINITPTTLDNYAAVESYITESDGELTLNNGIKRASSEELITINKDIIIDGNGMNLNANKGRVFNIINANVVIKNLSINNSYGIVATVVNATNSNVTLDNVTLFNHNAYNLGGNVIGILMDINQNSTLTIKNSLIENNTGAIVRTASNLTIDNSTIRNTKKVFGSTDSQGWIILNGGLTITNSLMENNEAQLAGIYSMGQKYPALLENSTFINNTVSTGRGGVMESRKNTTVNNCTFIENKVTNSQGREGGVFYNNGEQLNITSCIFINNTATANGSIIDNYFGTTNVENSVFICQDGISALFNSEEYGKTITANNNYWATNDNPKKYVASGQYWAWDEYDDVYKETAAEVIVDNWIIMTTTTGDLTNVNYNDIIELTTTFNKLNNTQGVISDYANTLPGGFAVEYESQKGKFANDVVEVVDGQAVNTYTVKSEEFTINVIQNEAINTITATAAMPEAMEIILNDGNYTEYFDDEGMLKDFITPNSVLKFDSIFKNRDIFINMPVTLTTYTNQAVFENCTIEFAQNSDNSKLTNVIMNNNQTSESIIKVVDTFNITIENVTLSQFNTEDSTHAIKVVNSHDVNILSSDITTIGPCSDIDFYGDKGVITSSIVIKESENVLVKDNNITTNATGTSSAYGTIESIQISGSDNNPCDNNRILNNNIITEAKMYTYAIAVSDNANDNLIDSNNITSYGTYYANAVELIQGARRNNVTNNNINVKAEDVTYGIYVSTNYMAEVTGNVIKYNNITADSSSVYLIELWSTQNNEITYNNFKANNNYVMAIGTYLSKNNIISYNNMTLTGKMDGMPVELDNILAETTGIKLTGNSDSNTITYNNITVNNPSDLTNTINITGSKNNIVTDNYLLTKTTAGNDAVYSNDDTNVIENNIPDEVPAKEYTIKVDTTEFTVGSSATIQASIYYGDEVASSLTNGKVYFKVNGKTLKNGQGKIIYAKVVNGVATIEDYEVPESWLKENSSIQAVYSGSADVGKLSSDKEKITVTTESAEPSITTEDVTTTVNQTVTLTATINASVPVNTGKVVFKVNGKTVKDSNGKVIYAKVVNGQVSVEYTLPENMKAGTYNITATYISSDYGRLEDTKVLTVN